MSLYVAKIEVLMMSSEWYRRIEDVIMNIEVQESTDESSVTNSKLLNDNLYPFEIQYIKRMMYLVSHSFYSITSTSS